MRVRMKIMVVPHQILSQKDARVKPTSNFRIDLFSVIHEFFEFLGERYHSFSEGWQQFFHQIQIFVVFLAFHHHCLAFQVVKGYLKIDLFELFNESLSFLQFVQLHFTIDLNNDRKNLIQNEGDRLCLIPFFKILQKTIQQKFSVEIIYSLFCFTIFFLLPKILLYEKLGTLRSSFRKDLLIGLQLEIISRTFNIRRFINTTFNRILINWIFSMIFISRTMIFGIIIGRTNFRMNILVNYSILSLAFNISRRLIRNLFLQLSMVTFEDLCIPYAAATHQKIIRLLQFSKFQYNRNTQFQISNIKHKWILKSVFGDQSCKVSYPLQLMLHWHSKICFGCVIYQLNDQIILVKLKLSLQFLHFFEGNEHCWLCFGASVRIEAIFLYYDEPLLPCSDNL